MVGTLEGLKFLVIKNKRNVYVVPSTKNYFGSIKVTKLIYDPGCSTHLLNIESSEYLSRIFSTYSESEFLFVIGDSTGVSGKCLTLNVKSHNASYNFPVSLSTDLLNKEPIGNVLALRFQLCTEDISTILTSFRSHFSKQSLDLLTKDFESRIVPRLSLSLLGNRFLDQFSDFKHMKVRYFVDASIVTNAVFSIFGECHETIMRCLNSEFQSELDNIELDHYFASENYDFDELNQTGYDF